MNEDIFHYGNVRGGGEKYRKKLFHGKCILPIKEEITFEKSCGIIDEAERVSKDGRVVNDHAQNLNAKDAVIRWEKRQTKDLG